jgi:hypothetical protein
MDAPVARCIAAHSGRDRPEQIEPARCSAARSVPFAGEASNRGPSNCGSRLVQRARGALQPAGCRVPRRRCSAKVAPAPGAGAWAWHVPLDELPPHCFAPGAIQTTAHSPCCAVLCFEAALVAAVIAAEPAFADASAVALAGAFGASEVELAGEPAHSAQSPHCRKCCAPRGRDCRVGSCAQGDCRYYCHPIAGDPNPH